MAVPEKLKHLVEQMPDPDERRMYCTNIDKEKIEAAIAEIAKGGKEYILGLIDMLGEPGSREDVKPHYALHCVINYTLITRNEKLRREFCEVLAQELSSNRSAYIRSYLCQCLQWAGGEEAVPALGKLLADQQLSDWASMALVAIRKGATEQFLKAWPGSKGRCRLDVIHGLAALAEPVAAAAFREALGDADREVRIAGGAGLAKLGDPTAVDLLLAAADKSSGWERIQQTKHCMVLAEKLAGAGKKAEASRIYQHLRKTRTDPTEKYIRDAAEKALAS
jgi:predicted nucleic acid-binding Zn ribbon protein